MTNEFIKPEELDDERLLYWATHHAKRFQRALAAFNMAQQTHEAFLAEVMSRGLTRKLMEAIHDK